MIFRFVLQLLAPDYVSIIVTVNILTEILINITFIGIYCDKFAGY